MSVQRYSVAGTASAQCRRVTADGHGTAHFSRVNDGDHAGDPRECTSEVTYSNGSTADLTTGSTWSTSDTGRATITSAKYPDASRQQPQCAGSSGI